MYELKPEFYNHFTPYFYHYTKAEQSKAEEAQRKRKKLANEDQCEWEQLFLDIYIHLEVGVTTSIRF